MVKKKWTHVKESALGSWSLPTVESYHPSAQSPEGYIHLTSILTYWWWSSTEVYLSRKCLKQMSVCKFVTLRCLIQNWFSQCFRDLSLCMYVGCITQTITDASICCAFRLAPQGREGILEQVRVQSTDWKPFLLYWSEFSKVLKN